MTATAKLLPRIAFDSLEHQRAMQAEALCNTKVVDTEVRITLQGNDSGPCVHGELIYADNGRAASLAATLLEEGAACLAERSALLPWFPVLAISVMPTSNDC
jgi:hypothetical protein